MLRRSLMAMFLCVLLRSVPTCAQSPPASASEQSFAKARAALEAGIKAMGGLEALREISDVTRELTGVRTDEGQGLMPSGPSDVPKNDKSVLDLHGQRLFDYSRATLVGGQPRIFTTVVSPGAVFSANHVDQTLFLRPQAAYPQARASAFRRYPESLLQTAWGRPEMLRWLGEAEYEGRRQNIITFADADGAQITLYFDARTGLLTQSETLADDSVLGDIAVETIYVDYRAVKSVMLPFRYIDKRGGKVLQDLRATSIVLNTHPPDGLFAAPQGFATMEPSASKARKLAEDVYLLPGAYNSLLVVFKEYLLVLEAGGSNHATQAAIAQIKEIAPNKPIRYLVATHHHHDHIAGIRSYMAEGAVIIAPPNARSVIEKAAGGRHVMRPDAFSRNPRAASVETLTGKRIFEDGAHTVELYDISPNPHAAEMLIAYLPKEKILFEADLLDLDVPAGNPGHAGDDTADLASKIQRLGLQVEMLVPAHGRLGTLDDLHKAVAKRAAGK